MLNLFNDTTPEDGESIIIHPWTEKWRHNDNLTLTEPMDVDNFTFAVNGLFIVVGLPANGRVIYAILSNNRLRNKPRYVYQLNIVLSNILTQLSDLFQVNFHFNL